MARKQTRRTVSLGQQWHARLTEYARAHSAPASMITEYALDLLMASPLDKLAILAWSGKRYEEARQQGAATVAANAATTPLWGWPPPPGTSRSSHPQSNSELAAHAVATEGISMGEAAERFGISRQAVHVCYRRVFGDAPTPFMKRLNAFAVPATKECAKPAVHTVLHRRKKRAA